MHSPLEIWIAIFQIPRILFQVGKLLTQTMASFKDQQLVDGFDKQRVGYLFGLLKSTYHSALCANEFTVYTEN